MRALLIFTLLTASPFAQADDFFEVAKEPLAELLYRVLPIESERQLKGEKEHTMMRELSNDLLCFKIGTNYVVYRCIAAEERLKQLVRELPQ